MSSTNQDNSVSRNGARIQHTVPNGMEWNPFRLPAMATHTYHHQTTKASKQASTVTINQPNHQSTNQTTTIHGGSSSRSCGSCHARLEWKVGGNRERFSHSWLDSTRLDLAHVVLARQRGGTGRAGKATLIANRYPRNHAVSKTTASTGFKTSSW